MNLRISHNIMFWAPVAALLVLLASACSTTRRLEDGEVLYNGMHLKVLPDSGNKMPEGLKGDLTKAVNVRPNNPWPLLSPYKRMPFPLGLWVYNNWSDSSKGIKKWLYDKWVAQPVLIQDVRPETRLKMLRTIADNNGYFDATASYELKYDKKNEKIATVDYQVKLGKPYMIDTVMFMNVSELPVGPTARKLCNFIDSMARRSTYLQPGSQFCIDSLEAERVRITNRLRNRGWYYFRPEYIEFMADSVMHPGKIALKMAVVRSLPRMSALQYKVGKITTVLTKRSKRNPGTPDTINTVKGPLIVYRPQRLRPNMIPPCITFREGRTFSVRNMDQTQMRLSRLGIFSSIDISAIPVDTTKENPTLDVLINCQYDRPMEVSVQANVTSKSNSYLGPGLILGVTHNNIFGGAERFSVQISGSYEWETGRGRSNVMNSYDFGLEASLAFPRLLAPKFVRRTEREVNWTTISLSGDILNRPHYFRLAEARLGLNYQWSYSRHVVNQLTLFKLAYTKLLKTTHDFDSIMAQNPAVALSFQSQFIPSLSYTYTYDRWLERSRINGINFTATLTEAGNIFWGLWRAFGVKGEKRMLGMPFSQFIKGQAQLVYSRRLKRGSDLWLVSRLLVGAEHAYGNSAQVPYAEQFYIGGANSIRAFTVRSIGPGSYRAPEADRNGYFDQTGTFKLEANAEFRFPIISVLHGAVFVDAGNIWLLKDDPMRPGGTLRAKTFGKDIALGTGVGLRVDIGMLVIRGDLGYGLHAPYATGVNGYFNIPFKDAFAFHLAIGYPF